ELKDVAQRYGHEAVLRGVGFTLERGRIGCLLGPSGSGKTTVLRCVAGFEPLSAGEIVIGDRVLSSGGATVPPEARNVGMVFQDYALFPHLTVRDNVGFGLHGLDGASRTARVDELLSLVDLEAEAGRFPHELSGGQQQRVAIARAVAPRPDVLLLDEPFSNLDVSLRERLGTQLRALLKQLQMTVLLVTHDQREAFALADEVGVIADGVLQQWGTPAELYQQPANRFVAGFVGGGEWVRGTIAGENRVMTSVGELRGPLSVDGAVGAAVEVLLRPDDIVVDAEGPLRATVEQRRFRGADTFHTLRFADGVTLTARLSSESGVSPGAQLTVRVAPPRLIAFPCA
ncbi:MAG: ABC transporter ATP-binding protein, partial [Pseudomonadota bacterium]